MEIIKKIEVGTKKFLHKWVNIILKSTNIQKVSLQVEKVPPPPCSQTRKIYTPVILTIYWGPGQGNNCELDHLQDVDMSRGVDRDGDYDNDDKNYDNGDGHID